MANLPVPAPLSEADYEAIEGAVMETARGRWFLAEYARRNRHADTTMLLKALDRIEGAMRGQAVGRAGRPHPLRPGRDVEGDRAHQDRDRLDQAGRRRPRQVRRGERGARLGGAGDRDRDLRHPRLRGAHPGDRLDAARAGGGERGLRPARCERDRGLYRLLVPGHHRPAHPQGDPGAALSGRPHQRDDRHLGPRRRDGGGSCREARGRRRQVAAQRAGEAGHRARPGRRRHGDGPGGDARDEIAAATTRCQRAAAAAGRRGRRGGRGADSRSR